MKPEPEDVAEKLRSACQELSRRLRAGEDVVAEAFLCSDVEVEQREAVLELLYTEFIVRHEIGQQPDPADWYRRFPQWESDLAELFEVHHYVCEQERERSRAAGMSSTAVGKETVPGTAVSGEAIRQRPIRGYELIDEIGRGGMGVVYKARQLSVNRVVALKMIQTRGSAGGAADARFRLEAEAAASLHQPHIAQVYEAGEQDGQPFLVMEYVAGPSLETALAKAPLTARSAAELLVPLAEAIEYAHQQGIIHRDLKPSNILLTPEGQPKITDFGLARRCDDARQARVTQTGVVLGTPAYMPPEQATGDHATVGPTSDVYGLGAILYESVTGRPPFVADSLSEILQQIQLTDPVRPCRLNPRFPKDLETICLKCLEKQPAARYGSAADLADDLRRFLNGEAIHARPAWWWERCHKWSRRRPAVAALLAVIVLVTLLGVTGVYWQTRQALLEARVSQETKKFFGKILESIDPAAARGRSITVREMLDEASMQLAAADIHRRIQAEVHDSLGITYARIGEPEAAEKHLRRAWQLYQAERGPGDAETLKMMSNLALVLKQLDRLPEAEALARQGLQTARQSLGERHRVYQRLLTNLAVVVDDRGRKEEAEQLYRQQLNHCVQARGPRHRDTLFAMANLGAWLMNNGRYQEAEQLISPCWKLQCELLGKDHPETLVSMQNLVSVLTNVGRAAEALPLGEQLLELSRRVHGPTALLTLRREENLAKLLFALERQDEAIKLGQHAYDELRQRLGATHSRVLAATETLVVLLGLTGRMEDAEAIALRAYTEVSSQLGTQHPSAARMARLLANLYESWDRPAEQQRWQGIADDRGENP